MALTEILQSRYRIHSTISLPSRRHGQSQTGTRKVAQVVVVIFKDATATKRWKEAGRQELKYVLGHAKQTTPGRPSTTSSEPKHALSQADNNPVREDLRLAEGEARVRGSGRRLILPAGNSCARKPTL